MQMKEVGSGATQRQLREKLLVATHCWLFGAEMSRTTRWQASPINLSCVSHGYFLETVNFSPVILNTE
jgi:hypothetical protein